MSDTVAELTRDMDRGDTAKALLSHPLIVEAFELLDKRCWEAFKATETKNPEDREYVHKLMRVQRDFKTYFEQLVVGGINAAALLKDADRNLKLRRFTG